jgi:hypothetical protein
MAGQAGDSADMDDLGAAAARRAWLTEVGLPALAAPRSDPARAGWLPLRLGCLLEEALARPVVMAGWPVLWFGCQDAGGCGILRRKVVFALI